MASGNLALPEKRYFKTLRAINKSNFTIHSLHCNLFSQKLILVIIKINSFNITSTECDNLYLNSGQHACERVWHGRADGDEGDGIDGVLQLDEAAEVRGDVADGRRHEPDRPD